MSRKKKMFFTATFVVLAGVISIFALSGLQLLTNEKAAYFDYDEIEKLHPRYAEVVKLRQSILGLQKGNLFARQTVQSTVGVFLQAKKIKNELAKQGKNMVVGNETQVKLAQKKQEAELLLAEKESAFRKEADVELRAYDEKLKKQYAEEILNLNLKLQSLTLEKEERINLVSRLATLEREQNEKFAAKRSVLLAAVDDKMKKERQNFKKLLDGDIKTPTVSGNSNVAKVENNAGMWKKTGEMSAALARNEMLLKQQEQELKVLENTIREDIMSAVAEETRKNGFTIVWIKVLWSRNMTDITDSLREAMTRI